MFYLRRRTKLSEREECGRIIPEESPINHCDYSRLRSSSEPRTQWIARAGRHRDLSSTLWITSARGGRGRGQGRPDGSKKPVRSPRKGRGKSGGDDDRRPLKRHTTGKRGTFRTLMTVYCNRRSIIQYV